MCSILVLQSSQQLLYWEYFGSEHVYEIPVEVVRQGVTFNYIYQYFVQRISYSYITMAATKNISIEAFQPGASVIQVAGRNFTDNHGRVLDLRGANVSSSSKVYAPSVLCSSRTNVQTPEATF